MMREFPNRVSGPDIPISRRDLLALLGVTSVAGSEQSRALRGRDDTDLVPEGGAAGQDRLGVAVDGDSVLVGAPMQVAADGSIAGSATLHTAADGGWQTELRLSPGAYDAGFGSSVALQDGTAAVGAPFGSAPDSGNGGTVAVYARSDSEWRRQSTLRGEDADGVDLFGRSVALAEGTLVVGGSAATTPAGIGTASVFTQSDGEWVLQRTLRPPGDGIDEFGRAVTLDSDAVVVGARDAAGPGDAGAAFVFTKTRGRWRRQARLAPSADGRDDSFGSALAMDSDLLVVGAPTETNRLGANAGAVYVYVRSETGWVRRERLLAGDGGADDQFGTSVALGDGVVVVGTEASGGPYVFGRRTLARARSVPVSNSDSDRRRGRTEVSTDGDRLVIAVSSSDSSADGGDGTVRVIER